MAKPSLFVPTLKEKERRRLRNHLHRSHDPHYSAHLTAVLLSERRMSVPGIARLLGRHPTSVLQWLKDYRRFGLRGLKVGKSPGRPRKVDEDGEACLEEALASNPRDLGYRFTRWSLGTLAGHLYARLHIRVHPMSVSRALHRMAYAYKRPKHSLRHRQKRWDVARARRERNAALKKLAPAPTVTPSYSRTSVSSICIPA
jgi:transposase